MEHSSLDMKPLIQHPSAFLGLSAALLLGITSTSVAETDEPWGTPYIGAQIFTQPGQTSEDLEGWFRTLKESDMPYCRIRLDETHMRKADGTWDFSLYDTTFQMADKYGVKVLADLFPKETTDWRLAKFPQSKAHLEEWAEYIKQMVTRFQKHPSLYAWVLQNEPGSYGMYPKSDLSAELMAEWRAGLEKTTYNSKGYAGTNGFDEMNFQRYYISWYLNWISQQIRKYDKETELHVNTHSIYDNLPDYDFAAWRKSNTFLGASCHPSLHYSYFDRPQFPMAISLNCDITRKGAGHLPFIVTELQGGNNTYSGIHEVCPTPEEITQWIWTSVGSGAKGVVFWTLNPRAVGGEAGEWAMVNFQQQPSDRLKAASVAARELINNKQLYATAKPLLAPVHLLFAKESFWMETGKQGRPGDAKASEGRLAGAMIKSVAAWYETLLENGINCHVAEIQDFEWGKPDYSGETIILSHQLSVPSRDWERLGNFVKNGGRLIADGLTFFFDENHFSVMQAGFPLEDVMGGSLQEVFAKRGEFSLKMDDGSQLPANLFKASLHVTTGKPFATENGKVLAMRNSIDKGSTVWIPSMLGIGARQAGNKPLAKWLMGELTPDLEKLPIRFKEWHSKLLMRSMKTDTGFLTILVNKSPETYSVPLLLAPASLNPSIRFADKGGTVAGSEVRIHPEETMVIEWRK
jgi:beta-galactosidase